MNNLLNDFNAFELFRNGQTDNISHFEDKKSKQLLIELQPSSFIELCNIFSINRDIESNFLNLYKINKLSNSKIEYYHPIVAKHLAETFGVLLYSEQVENILQDLAKFKESESIQIRKELGKRDLEKLKDYLSNFIIGCKKNSVFIEQCIELEIDVDNCILEIWNFLSDKIIDTISFPYVLKCVSVSFFQGIEKSRKQKTIS